MNYFIDFTKIKNESDLYDAIARELVLPGYFGGNLDALWDSLTGYLSLPAIVHFIDITKEQTIQFKEIFSVFQDAHQDMKDQFTFIVHPLPEEDKSEAG